MKPNEKETVADVAERVLADPAASEDAKACALFAKQQSAWLMQTRASGIRAAEERGE